MLLPNIRPSATLLDALVGGDLPGANHQLAQLPGAADPIVVECVRNARTAEAAPVWRAEPDGTQRFRFHPESWGRHAALIFGRWLDLLPLVCAVAAARPIGRLSLNLGDEGHRPGLAFCGERAEHLLIPDCMFVATQGYRALAGRFAAAATPWLKRRPVLFWRGVTSDLDEAGRSARVALCRLARAMGDRADIGISAVAAGQESLIPLLRLQALMRPFVAPEQLDRVQLHVDIDGRSNSWPGLFSKLLSGGAVLKVESPAGYRQWYYDRLVPWENYVPIRSDMRDLVEVASRLLDEPARAEAIGRAGRRLALELGYEAEVRRAVPAVISAFRQW